MHNSCFENAALRERGRGERRLHTISVRLYCPCQLRLCGQLLRIYISEKRYSFKIWLIFSNAGLTAPHKFKISNKSEKYIRNVTTIVWTYFFLWYFYLCVNQAPCAILRGLNFVQRLTFYSFPRRGCDFTFDVWNRWSLAIGYYA